MNLPVVQIVLAGLFVVVVVAVATACGGALNLCADLPEGCGPDRPTQSEMLRRPADAGARP